jgi:hypothetical protein
MEPSRLIRTTLPSEVVTSCAGLPCPRSPSVTNSVLSDLNAMRLPKCTPELATFGTCRKITATSCRLVPTRRPRPTAVPTMPASLPVPGSAKEK